MHLHRLSLGVLIALLTSLTPLSFKFTAPLTAPQALAQTPDARKVEADRFLQQGMHQYDMSQFGPALQSFQQALAIYRRISDRQGQANAFYLLGNAYLNQGKNQEAIKSYQQSLAIYQEISNY